MIDIKNLKPFQLIKYKWDKTYSVVLLINNILHACSENYTRVYNRSEFKIFFINNVNFYKSSKIIKETDDIEVIFKEDIRKNISAKELQSLINIYSEKNSLNNLKAYQVIKRKRDGMNFLILPIKNKKSNSIELYGVRWLRYGHNVTKISSYWKCTYFDFEEEVEVIKKDLWRVSRKELIELLG